MNRTVPTGRLCDTAAEKSAKLRRGSKLRPINKGTIYDIPGKLRKIVHEIETGKHGEVTDMVLALCCVKENNCTALHCVFTGTSQPEVLHYMAAHLQREILP